MEVRDIPAHKLFRDTFRHSKDISRVLVIVPHERLAPEQSISRRIIESSCDLFLQVDV